jgi:hypothetical protein
MPRRNQHGVEADVLYGTVGMGGEPRLGGGDDARALAVGDRPSGIVKVFARLHLDKNQQLAASRVDVDLADRRAETPRQNSESLGDEKGGGAAFGRNAGAEGDLTLQPGGRCKRAR